MTDEATKTRNLVKVRLEHLVHTGFLYPSSPLDPDHYPIRASLGTIPAIRHNLVTLGLKQSFMDKMGRIGFEADSGVRVRVDQVRQFLELW